MQQEDNSELLKIQDILTKTFPLLEQGEYYQYELKINTFGSRFANQNKVTAAAALYFVASKELLKREQINSGFSLAQRILDLYPKGQLDTKTQGEFLSLYSVAPFSQQKVQFINKVLQKFPQNNQSICEQVGIDLINNKKFNLAWRYLVHTDDVELQVSYLQKWNETLEAQDREFNVARYLLIKLGIGKDDQAQIIYDRFKANYNTLLFHLLRLLFTTIQLKTKQGFEKLYPKFQPIITIDPLFEELLTRIGNKYFGIPLQNAQAGLSGLLSSFFQ